MHLFGGRFRTGDTVEYVIFAGLSHITGGPSFAPFFYDWAGMYEQVLIDALEWKTNQFKKLH
ncbi:hypothetical protein B878_14055 [Vibrio campbellii CAIM 519 = NBRC 15631 = ATCC 25920]|nr:hypothetical protein B878_14055 [Vibrio campbellii CAIM 519 = NBRC 15631 = ATCC 25920]